MNSSKSLSILESLDAARGKILNTELYGVLNAVRVATKFNKPITDLMPRIEEVLKAAELEAADDAPDDLLTIIHPDAKPVNSRCTCGMDYDCLRDGPVPPYCPEHDGDYSSFLVSNNCD